MIRAVIADALRAHREHATLRRVLLAAAGMLLCASVPAFGATQSATPRTVFALQPVGPTGHRGYLMLDARPGATLTRAVRVANTGSRAGAVRLYAVDATTGRTTGAVYRDAREPRHDAGAWIDLPVRRVRLQPGQSRTIPVRIRMPATARSGQHLGGIVAETVRLARGPVRRQGRGTFRVDVRSLTIVAVQLDVPGRRREHMTLTGVRPGRVGRRQAVLVGMRNDGNQLVKGSGALVVRDRHGEIAARARFPIDTFVPRSAIADPVPVPGRALPAGRYRVTVDLRYGSGHVTRRTMPMTISSEQIRQVFGSQPEQQAPSARGSGPSLLLLVAGGLGLLVLGFTAALVVLRRQLSAARGGQRKPHR